MRKAGKYVISLFLVMLVLFFNHSQAQQPVAEKPASSVKTLDPSEEKFVPAEGIVRFDRPIVQADNLTSDHFTFYNEDGSVWYEVYWHQENPNYFYRSPKSDFKPIKRPLNFLSPMLRLKAESKNWYEVVVNEDTRMTKYLRIADRTERIGWERALRNRTVIFDRSANPLRLKPNGEPSDLEIPDDMDLEVIDVKGDWILLRTGEPLQLAKTGWIRWRKGDDILVRLDW